MQNMSLAGVIRGKPVRATMRLLEPIGNIPPAEAAERYYAMLDEQKLAA